MLERLNEEMTQEAVNAFHEKAKEEWNSLLEEYGFTTNLEFVFSEHQEIAMRYLINYFQVQEAASELGFVLPDLVDELEIDVVNADDFDEDLIDLDLDTPKTLH